MNNHFLHSNNSNITNVKEIIKKRRQLYNSRYCQSCLYTTIESTFHFNAQLERKSCQVDTSNEDKKKIHVQNAKQMLKNQIPTKDNLQTLLLVMRHGCTISNWNKIWLTKHGAQMGYSHLYRFRCRWSKVSLTGIYMM